MAALPALWQTRYGQVLLLKLALLAITAGIGLYNWKRGTPSLSATAQGPQHLRRAATVELVVGVGVLLVTAILVATPTPMDL